MSVRRSAKSATVAEKARSEVALSRSRRATRASGKREATCSTIFSVPKPIGTASVTRHDGHLAGTGSVWPQ